MCVIELAALSKWYGEVIALNDVTATLGRGITGLVGPNGAGKSTLMALTMGQLHPCKGTIRVLGRRPWDNPQVLSRIGYCPEGDPFWWHMTGWQFVHFLAKASGLGRQARSAAITAIDRTGMRETMNRPIRTYSKGMRQRIKLAQALAHGPRLLILDEPFTGMDPVGRRELSDLLVELAADGVDILISSHVLHEVEALTHQILMIDHGRIMAEGDLRAVRRRMHGRPYAICVRLDDPRSLAARLVSMEDVSALKVTAPDTLIVETMSPDRIYDRLPEIILEGGIAVREIASADESLEAVFGYLTEHTPDLQEVR